MRHIAPILCLSLAITGLSAALTPTGVAAQETIGEFKAQPDVSGPFVGLESHASLLTGVASRTLFNPTFGWALRAGNRWGGWGAFLILEQNMWITNEFNSEVVQGALNVGVGGEVLYANGFISTAIAAGPSILLFDTILDDAGEVGLFFDIRPTGLRWHPSESFEQFVIKLEPLTLTFVAPVLGGIPLIQVEYRTVLSTEVEF